MLETQFFTDCQTSLDRIRLNVRRHERAQRRVLRLLKHAPNALGPMNVSTLIALTAATNVHRETEALQNKLKETLSNWTQQSLQVSEEISRQLMALQMRAGRIS